MAAESIKQENRNPMNCCAAIERGLAKKESREIEQGLSGAYDLFVNYALSDSHDDILALGRYLNSVYYPYRLDVMEPAALIYSYLGQLRALVNLCDQIAQRLVPENHWHVVLSSKYGKTILQVLLRKGAMLATELCDNIHLPNVTQLSRTITPLIKEGLIRREKYGKNIWYSLTSAGRVMAARHFGQQESGLPKAASATDSVRQETVKKLDEALTELFSANRMQEEREAPALEHDYLEISVLHVLTQLEKLRTPALERDYSQSYDIKRVL